MPDGNQMPPNMPMQTREATVLPASVNAETRTIDVCWTTGARVGRYNYWSGSRYEEELVVDERSCDLTSLNNGAGVLDSHMRWSLDTHIGRVDRAWIEKGKGYATLRFADTPEVESTWRKISTGIVSKVSVGYSVRKYEITKEEGKPDLWRAVDWEPKEISMVSVPADAGAGTRSAGDTPNLRSFPCEFINRADTAHKPEGTMPDNTPTPAAAADPANNRTDPNPADPTRANPAAPPANPGAGDAATIAREAASAAIAAERQRVRTIRDRVRTAGLDEAFAEDLEARGVEGEHIATAIFDEMAKRGTPGGSRPRIAPGADHTDPNEISARMGEALASRASDYLPPANRIAMTDRARDFAGMGILELGIELARSRGDRLPTRMAPSQMYHHLMQRQLSTSDFPILLMDASNRVLRSAYELAAPTYKRIFARKTMRNFQPHHHLRDGDFPNLVQKGENGEFQFGTIGEAKEQLVLATWGRVMSLSRRILINDDLGAFAEIPSKIARRVAAFENATAYAVLSYDTDGPTLLETTRKIFNATDKTKAGSGAAIDLTTVSAARENIRGHKSIDGLPLNLTPDILLTSPANETVAQQFCNTVIVAATDATANPFKGTLESITDAALTGKNWYAFASQAGGLVYGHLEGAEGPQVMTREGFTTEGLDIRVLLDFVAGAIDYRGGWKNPQT